MLSSYLISVAAKSTLLLAAGLLGLHWLRKADAAVRHSICVLSLAGAICTLMLASWTPQWSVTIPMSASTEPHRWLTLVEAVWAIGALVMLLRWFGGLFALALARRHSVVFRTDEGVEVRSSSVPVPFTCGVIRPLILLPESARGWEELRLRAVLLHELAHVRRRDCLAKHLAQWSRALLWWNPLAWMLASRMDQEQERACDEAMLSAGVAPEAYAKALLDTARECSHPLLLGCAMGSSVVLRARLEHLFVWRPELRRTNRRAALAIPLLLALMTGVSCAGKRMPSTIAPGVNVVQLAPATVPQARRPAHP